MLSYAILVSLGGPLKLASMHANDRGRAGKDIFRLCVCSGVEHPTTFPQQ